MTEDCVIVLDCGSTNLRAVAVSASGKIVARASERNATTPDRVNADWHCWPFDEILEKLSRCARAVASEIDPASVRALTVTTFGVDGTFLDAKEEMLFPVISWSCSRTIESQSHMSRYVAPDRAIEISGVGHFAFNTLNKFIWFRENRSDVLSKARHFVFLSSLITHWLTGRLTNDATMIGTSQMADIKSQEMSAEILSGLGVDQSLFPETVFPGDVIGSLQAGIAADLGLYSGVPVISAGHDTQFAVFGAGAAANRPVLSSGTWEVLMARCQSVMLPAVEDFSGALTCEWDVLKGHYNPGYQYLASAVIEWVARTMFSERTGAAQYETMIAEAVAAPADCHGVTLDPGFLAGGGCIAHLSLDVDRGTLFRATLQALANRLKTGLGLLEKFGNFTATELTLVGGGGRNRFWTQLKADTLGIPVKTVEEPETTVLGAAMFACQGAGLYASAEAARDAFALGYRITEPKT